jgi:hypothetical protein
MTTSDTRKATTPNSIVPNPTLLKLNDVQRKVLSRAAQREDGAVARPESLTERAVQKLGAALVEKGQAEGVPKPNIAGHEGSRAPSPAATAKANVSPATITVTGAATHSQSERVAPRDGTKLASVIALLGRDQGAGIDDLTTATGWLRHTTRAALTGLRKRGFVIERARSEQLGSLYRIVNPERTSTAV